MERLPGKKGETVKSALNSATIPSWPQCPVGSGLWTLGLAAATLTLTSGGHPGLLFDMAGFYLVRSQAFLLPLRSDGIFQKKFGQKTEKQRRSYLNVEWEQFTEDGILKTQVQPGLSGAGPCLGAGPGYWNGDFLTAF